MIVLNDDEVKKQYVINLHHKEQTLQDDSSPSPKHACFAGFKESYAKIIRSKMPQEHI